MTGQNLDDAVLEGGQAMEQPQDNFDREISEYVRLLEKIGIDDRDPGQHPQREHRRFYFNAPEKTILLQVGHHNCALHDISLGGLSFYAGIPFTRDQRINVNFDNLFHVDIEILSCINDMEAEGEIPIYRHGSRFLFPRDGFRCTISVLRYYLKISGRKQL